MVSQQPATRRRETAVSVGEPLVTTSTIEAEYVALTFAAEEASWAKRLLSQLGYRADDTQPIPLYGDNKPDDQALLLGGTP